jgi:hypothetical protein
MTDFVRQATLAGPAATGSRSAVSKAAGSESRLNR